MSRTAITRGSLYNGSITMAIVHLVVSILSVLLGFYILNDYTWKSIQGCIFLLLAAVGILAGAVMVVALYARSSVLSLLALVLAFLEAILFIVLFGLYFFGVFSKSKALMVGDQNFLMPILAIQIFISLYFCFAYSRTFRYLYPVHDENQA